MHRMIARDGRLSIWEQEGGFSDDQIMIDDENLAEIIAELLEIELSGRGSMGNHSDAGYIYITIDHYDEKPDYAP